MKIFPLGSELFHAGGRAGGEIDMTELEVAFCSFAKAPKMFSSRFCLKLLPDIRKLCYAKI
jgi:hypothetical protein